MDNVTHVLAGMLLAEVVVQHRASREEVAPAWRRWAYVVSAAANNIPDLDILYTGITEGKLGYLAHHRGHTHTLAFALLQALLSLGLLRALRRFHAGWSVRDRRWMLFLAAMGPLLHLAMDGGNNYGVHPFWPIDSHWYYGDRMFIVEPLLWASLAPALAFSVRSRIAAAVLGLIALAGVVLSWTTGMVPRPLAGLVTLVTLVVGVVAWWTSSARRVAVAATAALATYALFIGVGTRARQLLLAASADVLDEQLLDAALTPLPANPLCWSFNSIALSGSEVVLRRGVVLPLSGEKKGLCPERGGASTAPLQGVTFDPQAEVQVHQIMRYPRSALTRAAAECHAALFLQWARIPYVAQEDDTTIVGDLRYDFDPSIEWAEIALPPEGTACPAFVPGWIAPRRELLVGR
ncbi:MAG: metal-dependent hydrolase [Polyangiaceae bacterium]